MMIRLLKNSTVYQIRDIEYVCKDIIRQTYCSFKLYKKRVDNIRSKKKNHSTKMNDKANI